MVDAKPLSITIVTDRKYHRYRRWKISKDRTTAAGIENSIDLLQTGAFKTIEQLAVEMKLKVPQVRWRLRQARDCGLLTERFYKAFAEPK
ncbi:hypothetical protein [Rhizobium leguminosarum]|uniref:hypothetical protein n=1 Tax=Rhizobium leguminosarum TaxID=384 RepID=UPI001C90D082|nr:hypothetical protein [Rhizobium leguminosarum]MBY2985103.1 hypothetical protein [Rhizobium leguminosarum]